MYYWGREGSAKSEIDFIVQMEKFGIVPIEVKSSTNTKAKSLKKYISEYKPEYAVRTSLNQYRVDKPVYDIPLYMISQVFNLL